MLASAGYRSFVLDTTTAPGYAWLRTGLWGGGPVDTAHALPQAAQ
jgi:hypothetical protein